MDLHSAINEDNIIHLFENISEIVPLRSSGQKKFSISNPRREKQSLLLFFLF